MKKVLHKAAISAEKLWDSLPIHSEEIGSAYIDPFIGYSTPRGIIVRGRVLDGKPHIEPSEPGSAWDNVLQMANRFVTREIAGAKLAIGDRVVTTDEEGYFSVELPALEAGMMSVTARVMDHGAEAQLPVIVTNKNAEYGVISDIDDTVIKTEAFSLARNIFNTLTGDVESRIVFPDSSKLLNSLCTVVQPIFYVSSSPWNLHSFLVELFRRNGVVPGPLFLRDFGIDGDKFIKSTHGEHKLSMIGKILEANPGLDFHLVGDTGQHDPEVYFEAIDRHPGRFRSAMFRIPDDGLDETDDTYIAKIRDAGVPVFSGKTFDGALDFFGS